MAAGALDWFRAALGAADEEVPWKYPLRKIARRVAGVDWGCGRVQSNYWMGIVQCVLFWVVNVVDLRMPEGSCL
jgi:hypothetical protein